MLHNYPCPSEGYVIPSRTIMSYRIYDTVKLFFKLYQFVLFSLLRTSPILNIDEQKTVFCPILHFPYPFIYLVFHE